MSKILAKKGNFTVVQKISPIDQETVHLQTLLNSEHLEPNMCIEFKQRISEDESFQMTPVYLDIKWGFIITPGEKYSAYEKLILPFDLTTWILLITTFSVAYAVMLIFKFCSQKVQDLFYGEEVRTPGLNILAIFFGHKTPSRSIPRFILVFFIIFCLIFRTAYQSVLYNLITTDPRKPTPKSYAEFYQMGYKIVTLSDSVFILKWFLISEGVEL
jgi:hypothetical protein